MQRIAASPSLTRRMTMPQVYPMFNAGRSTTFYLTTEMAAGRERKKKNSLQFPAGPGRRCRQRSDREELEGVGVDDA